MKTNAKAQWIAKAIGGVCGAFVFVFVLSFILKAYGTVPLAASCSPAAQASAVAAMMGGISNVPVFWAGLIIAALLYCVNFQL